MGFGRPLQLLCHIPKCKNPSTYTHTHHTPSARILGSMVDHGPPEQKGDGPQHQVFVVAGSSDGHGVAGGKSTTVGLLVPSGAGGPYCMRNTPPVAEVASNESTTSLQAAVADGALSVLLSQVYQWEKAAAVACADLLSVADQGE